MLSVDALTTLRAMVRADACSEPACFGYCLGARTKAPPTSSSASALRWTFGFHNTGYAFQRHVWERFRTEEEAFWTGGYGWDWSVWRLMQDVERRGFPRKMLYPRLSRVRNAGVKGGVTVDGSSALSTWLISGIPVSEGRWVVRNASAFAIVPGHTDGRDPREVQEFAGQDHYDCERFANGGFGAVPQQLDCPPPDGST